MYIAEWSSSVARRAHNPEVAGSNPVSATKSVTVVDTISATVIFYFPLVLGAYRMKMGVFRSFSALIGCTAPSAAAGCSPKHGFAGIAIVIRVETINDYFPYINPLKAEMLR